MPLYVAAGTAAAETHAYMLWLVIAGAVLVFVALTSAAIKPLPVSYALLYLLLGVLLGPAGLNLISWDAVVQAESLLRMTELAVIISLFASGVLLERALERRTWGTPLRLLVLAMPITIALVAIFGWAALGLPVGAAVLLGAILAPTDPVLASDVQVEGDDSDSELQFGLTAEAGLNDGLAFPFVTLGMALLVETRPVAEWGTRWFLSDVLWAVPAGLLIGYGIAYAVGRGLVYVRRRSGMNASLEAFAGLGLTVGTYAIADSLGAWGFLSAFVAGIAIGKVERDAAETAATEEERREPLAALHGFFGQLERLMEIGVMILLGGLLRWEAIVEHAWAGLTLAALLLFAIRPLSALVAMVGSPLRTEGRALAGWFGIRGIGSLYYLSFAVVGGLGGPVAERMTWVIFVVVSASVFLHGITATPLMAWYRARARRLESDVPAPAAGGAGG